MDELDIANLQTVPAVSDNLNSDRDIQMWHKIEYLAKGRRDSIKYFAFGDKYIKIKVELFNGEKTP